jgi:hypothetical protein
MPVLATRQDYKIDVAYHKYYGLTATGLFRTTCLTVVDTLGARARVHILITGNVGYVGSVLTRFLPTNVPGAELIGFDCGFFGHSLIGADTLPRSPLDLQYFGESVSSCVLPTGFTQLPNAMHKIRCRTNSKMLVGLLRP